MNPGLWREPRSRLWGLFMFPDYSRNKIFQVLCSFLFGVCLSAMPKWLCLQGMPQLAALLHFWFLTLSIVLIFSQLHFLETLPWLLREAVLWNSTKCIHKIWQMPVKYFPSTYWGWYIFKELEITSVWTNCIHFSGYQTLLRHKCSSTYHSLLKRDWVPQKRGVSLAPCIFSCTGKVLEVGVRVSWKKYSCFKFPRRQNIKGKE